MSPKVFNATPFAHQCFLLADPQGQLFFCAVLCATFEFDAAGEPQPCAEQFPVPADDEPFGEPGRSSVRRDSAATPAKQAVDVVIEATAHAPGGKPVEELAVGVRIGGWSKLLSVSGDRNWGGALRNRPSSPRPFVSMPIRYEAAFGGSLFDADGSLKACYPANPVGVGYGAARSADPGVATEVPNIELPAARLATREQGCAVAGFGVVARNWAPRTGFSGTYDEAWRDGRYPQLPADFDARFHQCAPLDQQFPEFPAGQPVLLRNLRPEGDWRFRMPSLDVAVRVLLADAMQQARVRVDTVLIDAERRRVSLIARHCVHRLRDLGLVREIIFGEPTRGWLRSRQQGKRYLGQSAPGPGP